MAAVCAVVGVGPGNGAAIARRFATEGYQVALLARSNEYTSRLAGKLGGTAHAYECDVTSPAEVSAVFERIAAELGPVDVLAYNAGSGVWGAVDEVDVEALEASWRVNVAGLFLTGRAVFPRMKERHRGAIIVTGATASLRGGAKTAAFAAAKAAQRSLAQSMARRFWPEGIHVALIIVDGVVDLPRTRERMPDKPDDFFVQPEDVASTAWWLSRQAPSAWSFEVEARPFGETW
ncbi:MAG: SDR family NAD(P)-dependent oxidoreductase [Gammaproteobacteria bacterium]